MKNELIFSNMNRYDFTGKRVAIFGIPAGDKMKVIVIPCNKKDQFCRVSAWALFSDIARGHSRAHAEYTIDVDPEKPRGSFLRWCNDNYYRIKEEMVKTEGIPLTLVMHNMHLAHSIKTVKGVSIKTLVR